MPQVGNKKFPYTRLGLEKVYQEAARTGKPVIGLQEKGIKGTKNINERY